MTTKISGANISSIGNTGLNWQAVTVADGSTQVNATSGNGYLLDTNTGVIEVFLPTSPTRGDTVVLADYSGTFATNKVIVNTGGVLIDSTVGSEVQITTNNTIAEFVYIDAAKGWLVKLNQAAGTTPSSALTEGNVYDVEAAYIAATGGTIATSGDFKIHTFTGDGCFVVSCGGNPAGNDKVDYLVVAGGGAGCNSGGGGGGGFREGRDIAPSYTASPLVSPTGLTITATTYPIVVGAGGSYSTPGSATSGSNSVFSTITSAGGGYGGGNKAANDGGSGGGGTYNPSHDQSEGSGNTPPVSPPQGNPGQGGAFVNGNTYAGGGGGGATTAGVNHAPNRGGDGGAGATTSISGTSSSYAGGGGGKGFLSCSPNDGSGGLGGGANSTAQAGTANTGGGGSDVGNGGKGIVIVRYKFQN